ncbi:hypothetical protein NX059_007163 [Plenodomus lindquistii]|nr:hypothetical protein NX059_007163 [Plenodomus lindquistii]
MATGSKKRRKSRSPSQTTLSKRVRRQSLTSTATAPSKQQSFKAKASRAKSVFRGHQDPYFPRNPELGTSLPTADDWVFRVKVISSATDLTNDVFKKAVQGLVKICFPDGVLEQLGIQVLEQHMHEENAPEENIRKMVQIFRAEMAHRVTWMLAEYMDTSTKLEAGVEAIVAASASLHGSKLGEDILGEVMNSLGRIRKRVPEESTHRLSDGAALREPIEESSLERSDESDMHTSNSSASTTSESAQSSSEESAPPRKEKKKKSNVHGRSTEQEAIHDIAAMDVDIDNTAPQPRNTTANASSKAPLLRSNKISTSWSWDIDPKAFMTTQALEAFSSASDLFAFHALPLARQRLGTNAKRKALRHKMEDMLAATPNAEYEKWAESFNKLLEGDRNMLNRAEIDAATYSRETSTATPAPIDVRRKGKEVQKMPEEPSRKKDRVEKVSTRVPSQPEIKPETSANAGTAAAQDQAQLHRDGLTETTAAFRHLSTEQVDIRPSANLVSVTNDAGSSVNQALQDIGAAALAYTAGETAISKKQSSQYEVHAPILDLLCGNVVLHLDSKTAYVELIMDNLNKRVIADSISVQNLDGTTEVRTKAQLHKALRSFKPCLKKAFPALKLKQRMEYEMIPWVVANQNSFPELLNMWFIFTNTLPCHTVVSDSLFDPRAELPHDHKSCSEMISSLLKSISRRDVVLGAEDCTGDKRIQSALFTALDYRRYHSEVEIRTRVEKILRRVAFYNRSMFDYLRYSVVVKSWENTTGLKW